MSRFGVLLGHRFGALDLLLEIGLDTREIRLAEALLLGQRSWLLVHEGYFLGIRPVRDLLGHKALLGLEGRLIGQLVVVLSLVGGHDLWFGVLLLFGPLLLHDLVDGFIPLFLLLLLDDFLFLLQKRHHSVHGLHVTILLVLGGLLGDLDDLGNRHVFKCICVD